DRGDRREQRARVRVPRLAEQALRLALLDDLAEVHHRDAVGEVADHAEVVGDEEVGEAELALEVAQEVQDLRLDRDVERRGRLVADEHARADGERARDADALALPARELVRIAPDLPGIEAHELEELAHAPRALRIVRADAEDLHALRHRVA